MIKIAHMADIHIRNLKYHSEYGEVFNRLYEKLREEKVDIIYVGGDIAHTMTAIYGLPADRMPSPRSSRHFNTQSYICSKIQGNGKLLIVLCLTTFQFLMWTIGRNQQNQKRLILLFIMVRLVAARQMLVG
mgnify:CR=1 FL=1